MPPDAEVDRICSAFGITPVRHDRVPFGSGLINQTYLLKDRQGDNDWLLQQVNTTVFTKPQLIAYNNYLAAEHLRSHHPDYPFMRGRRTVDGRDLFVDPEHGTWRMFPYFRDTVSHDRAGSKEQAYSAAQQFGRLVHHLDGVYVGAFQEIIPGFHDLAARYNVFLASIAQADPERKEKAEPAIRFFREHAGIVDTYREMVADPDVRTRITHNDTKLNNVLFDKASGEAKYVVDLDTLMPGKALFDLGDMIRTFISSAAEDDPDPAHCQIDPEIFEGLVAGWMSEMGPLLSDREKELIYWSGQMLMYEQGIRFLTDYLQGDVYYKAMRPDHNLDRAMNQMHLLAAYTAMEQELQRRVKAVLS
ncbi:MAG TPA: phosphotransferase [Flavobacteriales bacterium]|nr:phosphotransferase [Flavobacteriales bacterium]